MRPISDKLIFDRIHADRERVIRYMIYGLFVIAVLPVIIFRDFTPENELRYLCIADESLANGNFFAFTNNGVPYADKPPLYLWLVMLCRLVCGSHQMWLLSLLSLIPAFISVGVMNSMRGKELSQRGLTVASSMLLTTAYFLAMSVTLRMDMLMTMFILLAIRSYVRIHESQGNAGKERLLFPLWIFLAVFSKGPIGILVPLVTTLTFGLLEKDRKTLAKAWGFTTWALLISFCAIWFLAVYADGGREYLDNLLFHQTMGRAVNSFHHSRPVWWYCEAIWYVAAPWSFYAICMVIRALRNFKVLPDNEKLFFISAVTTFIILSLISGKLQVYLLPLLPFLIYGSWMETVRGGATKWATLSLIIPSALMIAVWPLTWFGNELDIPRYISDSRPLRIAAGILFCGGVTVIRVITSGTGTNPLRKGAMLLSATVLMTVFAAGFALPSLRPYIGWSDAANKITAISGNDADATRVVGIGVDRIENMASLLGGNAPVAVNLTSSREETDSLARREKDSVIISRFMEDLTEPAVLVTDDRAVRLFNPSKICRSGKLYIFKVYPGRPTAKETAHEQDE